MNEFLEDAAAFFAAGRQRSGKNKDWCILRSGQMMAETSERSVFTATRCKSADRRFTIILSVRANHGSISHLLTPCWKFMMRTKKMRITEEYVCIRLLSTEKKCVQVGKLPFTAVGVPLRPALFSYACPIGKCGSSSSSFKIKCCFISSSTASSSIMGV